MIIAGARACKYKVVRMESEAEDGRGAVILEEAGVGTDGGEGFAQVRGHDVPDLDVVVG